MSSPMCSLDKNKKSPSNPSKSFGKRSVPFRSKNFENDLEFLNELEQQIDSTTSTGIPKMHSWPPAQASSPSSSVDYDLDGMSSKKLLSPINSRFSPMFNPLGNSTKIHEQPKAPNDIEILSTMMKRITQLEKQTAFSSKEIIEKDRKIKVLEEKLSLMKKIQKSKENGGSSRVQELETKCHQLQQQIYEMEIVPTSQLVLHFSMIRHYALLKYCCALNFRLPFLPETRSALTFLADYGMIWVGDRSDNLSDKYLDDDEDDDSLFVPVAEAHLSPVSPRSRGANFKIDYDLIIRNVKELNIIAGEGVSKIEKTKDGARLKAQESIPLALYANGIIMFNGPFRPIEDIKTKRCLGDLMDGYFPSELQSKYPDGIPLNVTDYRHTVFKDPRLVKEFPGKGRVLQDDNASTSQLQVPVTKKKDPHHKDEKYNETSELPGPRMTVNQFVQKLPKNVVHDGKVIDIRSSLTEHLTDGKKTTTTEVVETKVVQELQERIKTPSSRQGASRNVTTIRVKCEDGSKTYILKMKFSDTIGDLKRYIDEQRPQHKAAYDVVSTFPKQTHNDLKKSLQDSGLVPNATLHLRPKK